MGTVCGMRWSSFRGLFGHCGLVHRGRVEASGDHVNIHLSVYEANVMEQYCYLGCYELNSLMSLRALLPPKDRQGRQAGRQAARQYRQIIRCGCTGTAVIVSESNPGGSSTQRRELATKGQKGPPATATATARDTALAIDEGVKTSYARVRERSRSPAL
jgi:hypothetical protein